MSSGLSRRVAAIERRNTAAVPMISASEVASARAQLYRKLGLPAPTEDCVPVSYKAVAKAGETVAQKLRSFLDAHSPL